VKELFKRSLYVGHLMGGLTSGVSGERSAAERVHCTPGLDGYAHDSLAMGALEIGERT